MVFSCSICYVSFLAKLDLIFLDIKSSGRLNRLTIVSIGTYHLITCVLLKFN